MTTHRPDPLTPDETRARDAVRGLERPRADAAFRERLKRDFVTGRIGERRVLELPLAWHQRLAWRLPDPDQATGSEAEGREFFRRIRDEIEKRVRKLFAGPPFAGATP